MQNYMPFGVEFNPKVMKDIKSINEKIEKEEENESPDKNKLMKLKMQQLMRGIELTSGLNGNNYRAMFPY